MKLKEFYRGVVKVVDKSWVLHFDYKSSSEIQYNSEDTVYIQRLVVRPARTLAMEHFNWLLFSNAETINSMALHVRAMNYFL